MEVSAKLKQGYRFFGPLGMVYNTLQCKL